MAHATPTRRATLALLAALAGAAVLPAAAAPSDFGSAHALFLKASAGDESAIEPAAEQLARLSAAQPAEPVLLAYAGAAEAQRARTTLLPWRKMKHADAGLALLDKALAQVAGAGSTPGPTGVAAVLDVRFVAANTFLALPSMFNRHARGEKLLAQVQADPLFAGAPAGFRQAVQQRAARLKEGGQ